MLSPRDRPSAMKATDEVIAAPHAACPCRCRLVAAAFPRPRSHWPDLRVIYPSGTEYVNGGSDWRNSRRPTPCRMAEIVHITLRVRIMSSS
ncbi:hypothetical protein J6590_012237 [Homalodisca vitripennis]|nr:hypothetical protein J6590_012237 [Homalodisca vitripennis]